MLKYLSDLFCIFLIIFICWLFYSAFKIISVTQTFSDNVTIAFIGALAGLITILGSVVLAQRTARSNAQLQRDMEARKLKQEYYHNFLEALSIKHAFLNELESGDGFEANKTFCTEVNRLPLYASQEIVEVVNQFAAGGKPPEFSEFYELVRKDLCSNSYECFEGLKQMHFQLPNKNSANQILDPTWTTPVLKAESVSQAGQD